MFDYTDYLRYNRGMQKRIGIQIIKDRLIQLKKWGEKFSSNSYIHICLSLGKNLQISIISLVFSPILTVLIGEFSWFFFFLPNSYIGDVVSCHEECPCHGALRDKRSIPGTRVYIDRRREIL